MARILDQVVGHSEVLPGLLHLVEKQQFPGTLLLAGRQGIGRMLIARGLAQALNCERGAAACGECGSCLRIAKNVSEAFTVIEADSNQIKAEQARGVLDLVSLQSPCRARVIVFAQAELLNAQAANTLLKVLEEPPQRTHFILLAPSSRHLLATIRSRCVQVTLKPIRYDDMIKKLGADAPSWVVRSSQGSFSRANELMQGAEVRELALEMLRWWVESPQAYLRPAFRERVKDRTLALPMARLFQCFFRDIEISRCMGEQAELINQDQDGLFAQIAERLEDPSFVFRLALGLERELLKSRDSLLLFEEFWIRSHAVAMESKPPKLPTELTA